MLKVDAQQKSWGPQFLLFGFGVSTTFNGQGVFNLQPGASLSVAHARRAGVAQ
ncbi:hypothetical protein ACU4GD_40605 [Cupriavidus basilensis]